jgi:hypothetical protein
MARGEAGFGRVDASALARSGDRPRAQQALRAKSALIEILDG